MPKFDDNITYYYRYHQSGATWLSLLLYANQLMFVDLIQLLVDTFFVYVIECTSDVDVIEPKLI